MRGAGAIPILRVAMQPVWQLLPHERSMAARRGLALVEQSRARAPHHGRRNRTALVMTHDIGELVHMVETEDDHEGTFKLRMRGAGGIVRRLAQIEIESKQRRQDVVLELRRLRANSVGHQSAREQVDEGLVRIERGRDEVARAIYAAVCGLDTDCAAAFNQYPPGFTHQGNVAAVLPCDSLERARQRRTAAARHLGLSWARKQAGNVVAEATQPQIDLAQAVEEQQPGLDRRMLEFLMNEFERRECADFE